jgi:UbiD family decarboxylase
VPYASLREFIQRLEAEGEVAHVRAEVDLVHEVGAVCYKTLRARGPALIFDRPGGYDVPLAVNLLANRRRYGLAIEADPDRLHEAWTDRIAHPVEPVVVPDGPCKEHVLLGDDVDLFQFPIATWNEHDAGPFITLSCHISKDPSTGRPNVGVYRAQVHDRRTVGVHAGAYAHIRQQWAKRPDEPFPVAMALGVDPALVLAAVAPFPFGTDELAMAGGLRRQPLELVRCETVPLEVPAAAEIVLEGEMLPSERLEEGPFGEFLGYYGPRHAREVIRIKAITHRHQPIHHATYTGRPPHESSLITAIPREAEILRQVPLAGLVKIHVTQGGGGAFNAVAAISKQYEGQGKLMALSILGTQPGRYIKNLIVVDEDVDPFDWTQVEWALATHVQANRDVDVCSEMTGVFVDPSLPDEEQRSGTARTAKLIVDATRHGARTFPTPVRPDPAALQRVEREWDRYGIPVRDGIAAPLSAPAKP